MDKPLISVIVPVYNVEKFLCRCIDSLVNQTYKNLEIILVDDGTPDKSGGICDDYASKDERIKVIHKENGGVSSARNVGLDVAKGEYIAFVDADDFIDETMYEKLYGLLVKNEADIAICPYAQQTKDGTFNLNKENNITQLFDKQEVISLILKQKVFTCAPWGKLLKRELVGDTRFDTEISHNEDLLFIYQVMKNCDKAIFTYKQLYYYCYNEQSAARSSFSDKNTTMLKAQTLVLEDIKENVPQIYDVALTEYVKTMIFNLTAVAKSGYKNKAFIKKLQSIVRKNLKFFLKSYVAKGYKIYALIISISFDLFKFLF